MITDDLVAARSALEGAARDFDPSACSGDEAVRVVEVVGTILKLADGILGKAAKRVEDTAAHVHERDRNATELGQLLTGRSTGEVRRAIDLAAKLEALPATDAAVRAGRLSSRSADLIVAVAADDPAVEERMLAAAAEGDRVLRDVGIAVLAARENQEVRSARQHAERSFRMWTAADGMVEGRFRVPPEAGGAIKARIDNGTRRAFRTARQAKAPESQDAYAADAFIEALTGDPATAKPGGYTTHIVIDHEALLRGNALPGERCEIPGVGPVSAEWVRGLIGSAFVTAVVAKGKDIATVAHLGRHIPAELQTALLVSGRECVIEGCTGREYLERDHCEIDHARDGPTAFWNLAWLSSVHHTLKTRGWILGPPDPFTGKRRLDPPAGRTRTGRAA
jgi:hypothetical protein